MKALINYDYDMKKIETHWYILMFYSFESTKNPITIVLSYTWNKSVTPIFMYW